MSCLSAWFSEPDVEALLEQVRKSGVLSEAELSLVVESLLVRNENTEQVLCVNWDL